MSDARIYGTNWRGEPMVLVHAETGYPVEVDEKVYDFRGDPAYILNGRAPHKAESTGRVSVLVLDEEGYYTPEFFPSVFNLKWARI